LGLFSQFWADLFSRVPRPGAERSVSGPDIDGTVGKESLDLSRLPRHIGVIMDGNGRWATNRGLPRTAGHREGLARVREIVTECVNLGIENLTLYAFSTENWKRPEEEVSFLMNLFRETLKTEVDEMHKQRVRVRFIGEKDKLDPDLVKLFTKLEKQTENNYGLNLNIAINYGSRREILSVVRSLVRKAIEGEVKESDIDEELFASYLYTAGQPDPELIIRTSGEERLSNFLLWQAAYAEFVFVRPLWPEFGVAEFHQAIYEYQSRNRRFGTVT